MRQLPVIDMNDVDAQYEFRVKGASDWIENKNYVDCLPPIDPKRAPQKFARVKITTPEMTIRCDSDSSSSSEESVARCSFYPKIRGF